MRHVSRTGNGITSSGGKLVKAMGLPSPPVSGIAFSRDGRRLAATHVSGLVEVWDTEKDHAISSFYDGNSLTAGMAFHLDSERLFTGGFDRLVTISEPRTRRQLLVFRELSRGCSCLALSADGNRLAAGSVDGSIHGMRRRSTEPKPIAFSASIIRATYIHSILRQMENRLRLEGLNP